MGNIIMKIRDNLQFIFDRMKFRGTIFLRAIQLKNRHRLRNVPKNQVLLLIS
jgi:hypothetical protein